MICVDNLRGQKSLLRTQNTERETFVGHPVLRTMYVHGTVWSTSHGVHTLVVWSMGPELWSTPVLVRSTKYSPIQSSGNYCHESAYPSTTGVIEALYGVHSTLYCRYRVCRP